MHTVDLGRPRIHTWSNGQPPLLITEPDPAGSGATAGQNHVHDGESFAREAEHYLARRQTYGSRPEDSNKSGIPVNDHMPRTDAHPGGMKRRATLHRLGLSPRPPIAVASVPSRRHTNLHGSEP